MSTQTRKRKSSAKGRQTTKRTRLFTKPRSLIPRIPLGKTYQFRQVVNRGVIQSSMAALVETNYQFQLNDIYQYTNFTSLFDAYRIDCVVITLIPRVNATTTGNVSYASLVYTAIDHDDVAGISTTTAIEQFQTCKTHSSNAIIKRIVKPLPAIAMYKTGVAFAYAEPTKSMWIDCANPDVPHYGLRTMVNTTAANNAITFDVTCQYFVTFKNVR